MIPPRKRNPPDRGSKNQNLEVNSQHSKLVAMRMKLMDNKTFNVYLLTVAY